MWVAADHGEAVRIEVETDLVGRFGSRSVVDDVDRSVVVEHGLEAVAPSHGGVGRHAEIARIRLGR